MLVGRPNVGKSTLFNRITGSRRAIVSPVAGTTRDALARPTAWQGTAFDLYDTGGLFGASDDPLHELVVAQGTWAIEHADLLVLVVDGREGLVPADEEIALRLRETGRPVLVALNKTDDKRARDSAVEFYRLGFDPIVEISAEHGDGVAELLDEIVKWLRANGSGQQTATRPSTMRPPPSAISRRKRASPSSDGRTWGSPRWSTGCSRKSGCWSARCRARRATRSTCRWSGIAGISASWIPPACGGRDAWARGGKVEVVSVALAKEAIADADVVALVIDANEGATDLDAAIGGEVDRAGRGIVIIANKWDLVKGRAPDFSKKFDDETRRHMRFLDYAPILHISALTGERTPKILETIDRIAEARRKRVPTPALNKFVETVTAANPPVSPGRRHVRILYAAQIGVAPPSFVFFTNVATTFHFSYERFLVNKLREHFGFAGSPIRTQVRSRGAKARPSTR